ncbi:MAG: tRNA (N(6)-L-threonylcarbamoyladenosine(37)-C(2))-methylthiotransferase MtaB [Christensenellales bacterium]
MTKKKAAFHTLGCKANQYDTEAMLELFVKAGYDIVDFNETADVYIINTCSVTGTGESKSRQFVGRAKRNNPQAVIGVVGCYPQHNPTEVLSLPGVSFIAGSGQRGRTVELVEQYLETKRQLDAVEAIGHDFEDLSASATENRTRAYMKIQDGCENYCTYCIIPYTRGPRRSRPLPSVIGEAKRLKEAGYEELVLTGIHIASYGCDLGLKLSDAIGAVCQAGFARVRLGSLEPGLITEEFIRSVSRHPNLCPHFHVSLQSGSAAVLERMERKYTPGQFRQAVMNIRKAYPRAGITTDVMVGFPGETEEEHRESTAFVSEMAFSRIHVFVYSPRPGTKAAAFSNQVANSVKDQRSHEMQTLGLQLTRRFEDAMIGSRVDVLFETKESNGYAEGYTDNYVRIKAPAEQGKLVPVLVSGRQGDCLLGDPFQ